jgi:hypothetical protein
MNCTRHFGNIEWEHHTWRPRVFKTESLPTKETNMWGRTVYGSCVRCFKQEVCTVCGATRNDQSCVCDDAVGEQCAIRLDWLEHRH